MPVHPAASLFLFDQESYATSHFLQLAADVCRMHAGQPGDGIEFVADGYRRRQSAGAMEEDKGRRQQPMIGQGAPGRSEMLALDRRLVLQAIFGALPRADKRAVAATVVGG